jgi:hypothetical protein
MVRSLDSREEFKSALAAAEKLFAEGNLRRQLKHDSDAKAEVQLRINARRDPDNPEKRAKAVEGGRALRDATARRELERTKEEGALVNARRCVRVAESAPQKLRALASTDREIFIQSPGDIPRLRPEVEAAFPPEVPRGHKRAPAA